jgi:hypothetical protein
VAGAGRIPGWRGRERSEQEEEGAAAVAALLWQERAGSWAVGERPPEPPLRPAKSHGGLPTTCFYCARYARPPFPPPIPHNLPSHALASPAQHPNKLIESFKGTFQRQGQDKEVIDANNTLLRGCTLRNVDWVFCLVVNTGLDTKIMMSNSESPVKLSSLEQRINHEIKAIVM